MGIQSGIPLFYLQNWAGAQMKFLDLFNDGSIFWAWVENETDVNRTVVESAGLLNIGVVGGGTIYARWDVSQNEAPKVYLSPMAYPCEIITKLSTASLGDKTQVGICFSNYPKSGFGADIWYGLMRRKVASEGHDGIAVCDNNNNVNFYLANTTLPVWFRLRMTTEAYRSARVFCDYSYDGVNYISAHNTTFGDFSRTNIGIALVAMNCVGGGITRNGVSGGFDYFLMRPKSIN